MDAPTMQAALLSSNAAVERQFIKTSGPEHALDGPSEAVTTPSVLLTAWMADSTAEDYAGTFERFSSSLVADDPVGPPVAAMAVCIGNLISAAQRIVESTNALEPGKPPSVTSDPLGTTTGTAGKVQLDWSQQVTEGALTATSSVFMEIVPCPGPDGKFTAKAKATVTLGTADGAAGSNMSFELTVTGQVDDDAKLVGSERQSTVNMGGVINRKPISATSKVSMSEAGGKLTQGGQIITTATPGTPPEFVDQTGAMTGQWTWVVGTLMLEAAEGGWKSGRCVSLDPTTQPAKRTGLTPSAASVITAQPKSKIDGWPVGGTVKATLSGEASVDPVDKKIPAVARFTYTAPSQKDKGGTVSLEARSKRGIAKADVSFDTNSGAFEASGGLDEFHGTGTICDLTQPFTIQGSGVTQSFSPTSNTGGTYSYTGNMSGFPVKGTGTYTVKVDSKGGTITATGTGEVTTPMGVMKGSGTEIYTLTPIEKCK
jgi:hypothetical protein